MPSVWDVFLTGFDLPPSLVSGCEVDSVGRQEGNVDVEADVDSCIFVEIRRLYVYVSVESIT